MRPHAAQLSLFFAVLAFSSAAADRWSIGAVNPWEDGAIHTANMLSTVPGKPLFYSGNSFRSLADGSPTAFYTMKGSALSFNSTWDLYVVGGHDLAKIYDGTSGHLRATLNCQDEPGSLGPDAVSCAAFSRDDRFLITGGFKQVKVWDWEANRLVGTIPLTNHGIATQVGVTADNQYLVVALKRYSANCCDFAGEMKIFRLSDLQEIRSEETPYAPVLAFSPNDSTIAFSSGPTAVRIWNINEALEVGLLQHSNKVTALAFSPDGSMLTSGSADLTTRTWCTSSGRQLRTYTTSQIVNNLAYTADGSSLLVAENNSRLSLAPVFTVTIQPASEGHLKLAWEGGCGRYQVQFRDITSAGWSNFGEPLEVNETLVSASTPGRIFRVLNAP